MIHKKEALIKFLSLELEDLHEDIDLLIEKLKEKHNRETITNYVFLENMVVFKSEIFGVESFYEYVKNIDTNAYATLEQLQAALYAELTTRVKKAGLPEAVIYLIDRKIKKVIRYIEKS